MIPGANQFEGIVSKVVKNVGGYVGNLAREARDIPTAIGTGLAARMDRENAGPSNLQKTVDNDTRAGRNTRAQVKDVFQAIGGRTDGTRSDQITDNGAYRTSKSLQDQKSRETTSATIRGLKPLNIGGEGVGLDNKPNVKSTIKDLKPLNLDKKPNVKSTSPITTTPSPIKTISPPVRPAKPAPITPKPQLEKPEPEVKTIT